MLELYDTTLRDGAQSENISFSVEDKIKIIKALDELGVHFAEGGWPGANPAADAFFRRAHDIKLENIKLTAFSSTHRLNKKPDEDKILRAVLDTGVEIVTIFGKSWDLHVTDALGTTLERNLELINDSIVFFRDKGLRVFYDA